MTVEEAMERPVSHLTSFVEHNYFGIDSGVQSRTLPWRIQSRWRKS